MTIHLTLPSLIVAAVMVACEAQSQSVGAAAADRTAASDMKTSISKSRSNVLSTTCDRYAEDPEGCIAGLFTRYPGDGVEWIEIGTQLAIALAAHPSAFFRVAGGRPEAFERWVRDLPEGTFQVFARKGTVQGQITAAHLEKLKDLMLTAIATPPLDQSAKTRSEEVARVLRDIHISFLE